MWWRHVEGGGGGGRGDLEGKPTLCMQEANGGQQLTKILNWWDKQLKRKTHSNTNYWLNACRQPYHPSSHGQLAVSTLTCTHQHGIPPAGVLPYNSDRGARRYIEGFKFVDWYRLGCYDLRWLLPELSRYLLRACGKVVAQGYRSEKCIVPVI